MSISLTIDQVGFTTNITAWMALEESKYHWDSIPTGPKLGTTMILINGMA